MPAGKYRETVEARTAWATNVKRSINNIQKSMITEGDFVMVYMGEGKDVMVGRVEYVMTNPGLLGLQGSEYALEYMEDDKPIIVRVYEQEDGAWEEKGYVHYHRMSEVIKIESLSVSVEMVMEIGSNGTGIPSTPEKSDMQNMYDVQIGKSYNSDNEEEDKWDNMAKACWVGYEQRGMKDKGGRMVPNCVPISNKSESKPTTKSIWGGAFDPLTLEK
jgi:hypothetical protein